MKASLVACIPLAILALPATAAPSCISATDFGAVGDGGTDNTAALQRAFDYAKANNMQVYIQPGNYVHSGVVRADSIVVFGGGDETQLIAVTAGQEALVLTGQNPALYNVQMAGVALSRLDNNKSAQVLVQDASGFTVENVHVVSSSSVGIFTIGGTNGSILHNTIERTLADGIYTTVASSHVTVANNLTIATGDDAISVSSYTGDPDYTHDITIKNNTVIGNWESRSITVNGGHNITISDNYIDGGTAGVAVGSESEWGTRDVYDVLVTGNTIQHTTFTGEGTIGGGGLSLYSNVGAADLTLTGNATYLPAHDGILVLGTTPIQATIRGNKVYASTEHPVYVNKDRAAVIRVNDNPRISPTKYVAVKPIPGNGVDPALVLPTAKP